MLHLRARRRFGQLYDFPWRDPATMWDFDFYSGQYYSRTLGLIAADQAISTTRASTALVFDGNGLLVSFAANTPCITMGRGLWAQTSGSCRLDFNNTLSNAAWIKPAMTVAQDLPSPFAVGTPNGWRITALTNLATITQPYTTIAPAGSITMSLPHAIFYLPIGATLNGPVEITQDGVLWTDIRSQLLPGRWVQIPGTPQDLPAVPITSTFGIRISVAGDSIGFCLGNVERGYTMTSPILTPGAATVNRLQDINEQITANFPSLSGVPQFTILVACRPGAQPLPPFGSLTMPRTGWTVLEINNPYDIVGTGVGELTPYGGVGQGSLMVLDSADPGSNFVVGSRLTVGTGVGSFSDITQQLTSTEPGGALGGRGTYRVFSTIYPDGQTTPVNIVIQARTRTAQGYALNAALKPDDPISPFAQRIGVTVTAEPYMNDFGNDPQNTDYTYNEVNAEGWTVDTTLAGTSTPAGTVALKGDTEQFHTDQFTHAPQLASNLVISYGHQYPSGGPLDGDIQRVVAIEGFMSQAAIASVTTALQLKYTVPQLSLAA